MQYIDFCCKKTTREHIVLRIKNSVITCNPLTKNRKNSRVVNTVIRMPKGAPHSSDHIRCRL